MLPSTNNNNNTTKITYQRNGKSGDEDTLTVSPPQPAPHAAADEANGEESRAASAAHCTHGAASSGGERSERRAGYHDTYIDGCQKHVPSEAGENKPEGKSCVIPGVEHVFFEDELAELERMEQEKSVIVLAVDDGCHSEMAFKFYLENVDRPGYLLHIVHHSDVWSHYKHSEDGPSANHCKEIAEKVKGVVDEVEEKYNKLMKEHNIQGQFVSLHGKDAWHDIIQYQESSNAIMIVMGTRGSGALSRTFRGSVSDSVVHHAHVPVLVCCHPKD